ncbi:hypothetical protein [Modestobacter sp. NPDC049651]|uniref:hypothetical protein n=1 Tax=unclassified Modestobacter TaxID=2643866 RepID=UPI003405D63C
MHVLGLELQALGKILLVGLLLGAGLPVLFSAGIRAMAWGTGGEAETHPDGGAAAVPHPLGRVLGVLCFAVVLACVALGITYVVASGFGKTFSFEHVVPTLVDKS